jgi:cytidine deaminase
MKRKSLLATARKAALHAYAPYSHFRVGAAVVVETSKGPRVVTGANIENGSFGLTLCAERSALAAAYMLESSRGDCPEETMHHRPPITQVAVACIDVPLDAPDWRRSPCGACRQWMAELAPDAVFYVDGIDKDLRLADLLPYAFRLEDGGRSS